jgi:hypothetical protein
MKVGAHFERADDNVRAVYQRLLATIRANGPFSEDVKKTSIPFGATDRVCRRGCPALVDRSHGEVAGGHHASAHHQARTGVRT